MPLLVDIGRRCDQHAEHINVALLRSNESRRGALRLNLVDVSPRLDQSPESLDLVILRGEVNRRRPNLFYTVDISSRLDENVESVSATAIIHRHVDAGARLDEGAQHL